MSGEVSFNVDTSRFNEMARRLEYRLKIGMPNVIRAEAGAVLKACFKRTKFATEADVDRSSHLRNAKGATKSAWGMGKRKGGPDRGQGYVVAGMRDVGKYGNMWLRSPWGNGRNFVLVAVAGNMGNATTGEGPKRIGAATRAKFESVRNRWASSHAPELKAGRGAIGLAKQSWLQIALDLNINLNGVKGGGPISKRDMARASHALSVKGKRYSNGNGTEANDGHRFTITLNNTLPYAVRIGMDRTLQSVLIGRAKLFDQLIKRGLGEDLTAIQKAFPNL